MPAFRAGYRPPCGTRSTRSRGSCTRSTSSATGSSEPSSTSTSSTSQPRWSRALATASFNQSFRGCQAVIIKLTRGPASAITRLILRAVRKSQADDDLRRFDSRSSATPLVGGAEASVAAYLRELSPRVEVVVMGVAREVVEWIAGQRERATSSLVPPVRGKWDLSSIAAHLVADRPQDHGP